MNYSAAASFSDRYDVQWMRKALIICDLQRPGAWKDVQRMSNFFEDFGFDYTVEGRPTDKRLMGSLENFRQSMSYCYVSCFIMVIMAHGKKGHIILPVYREDYKHFANYAQAIRSPPKMELGKIFQMFDNRQCPTLREKPKLFIVQACRGDDCHSHLEYPSLVCDANRLSASFLPDTKLPTMSDCMIVYSAYPGKPTFRHPDNGCPLFEELDKFVRWLVEKNQWHSYHMREIFTKVTANMEKRFMRDWAMVGEYHPQDSGVHIENTLSKKWYLFHM